MRQMHLWVVVALLTGGCARSSVVNTLEEGAPCLQNEDCGEGMRCIDDACQVVTNCQDDTDCHSDQSCANGFCVGNQGCSDSRGCPDDQICENSVCRRMGDCRNDSDCPDEASCEDGSCRQNPTCDGDADCPADQHCGEGGLCQRNDGCLTSADCAVTETCEEGVCNRTDACTRDVDCPGGQHCGDAGLCERNDRCSQDSDCPLDQSCEAGACTRNPSCSTHADCPADEACVDGQCLRHAGCRDDSECDNGVFCDGAETCSLTEGCLPGTAPVVDDNLDCTQDYCDEDNDEVVHTARHQLCNDDNVCTDDRCDLAAGCLNVPNDGNTPAQVNGDCSRAACSSGQLIQTPDDSDLPADDGVACTAVSCSNGSPRIEYRHDMCNDNKPCTLDQCTASGCANPTNTSIVPDQTPNQYCLKQECGSGGLQTVADPTDVPPDNNPNDCVSPACDGSTITTRANNNEVPIGQAAPDPCMKWACVAKTPRQVYDDTAVAPADADHNCRKNICSSGISSVADVNDAPSDTNAHDCISPICYSDGSIGQEPNNQETPADLTSPGDCLVSVCFNGSPVDAADISDVPPDTDPTDCTTFICNSDGSIGTQPDNTETPPQVAGNCQKETCSSGGVSSTQDNTDQPASDGIACTDEVCNNGSPQHTANNALCSANNYCDGEVYCDATPQTGGCKTRNPPTCSPSNATCFTGSCDPSAASGAGACVDVPINGDGDPVAKCGPDNTDNGGAGDDDCNDGDSSIYPGAPELPDGKNNDCDSYTDEGTAILDCGSISQVPNPAQILTQTTVTVPYIIPAQATPPGAPSFSWSVTQEPFSGLLPLNNPRTVGLSAKVDLTPVLYGDYEVTAWMSQIGTTAVQSCPHAFTVQKPSVGINVTMVMHDSVDVDLHLTRPGGSTFTAGDCYWGNCAMCTVLVPGQPSNACNLYGPQGPLDWDASGGTVYPTAGDPTLDVDNQRGCYTDASGNLVCIPESTSLQTPPFPGNYTVSVNYYGGSSDGTAAPYETTVTVQILCAGAGPIEITKTCTVRDPAYSFFGEDWCNVALINWGAGGCNSITPL